MHDDADQCVEEHRTVVLPSRLVEEWLSPGGKGKEKGVVC